MALVAAYGLAALVQGRRMTHDLLRVHWYMLICYLALLGVDLVNGGGLSNLTSTGVSYLPLLALAPYAFALRILGLGERAFDRAIQITILIAAALSCFGRFYLGEQGPGGPNLNAIPYGFVIAIWGVYALARGLEAPRERIWSIAAALLAILPILLTQSKMVWGCMLIGYFVVSVLWAAEHRRWTTLLAGLIAASAAVYGAFVLTARGEFELLWGELSEFFLNGSIAEGSFGYRYELTASGFRAFLERPVFGHGLNERMAAAFAHSDPAGPDITILGHLHNDYVTHLVAYGLIGAVFVLAYFVFIVRVANRCPDPALQRAGIALLTMLIVYMAAEIAFNMDPITSALTLALGVILASPAAKGDAPGDLDKPEGLA